MVTYNFVLFKYLYYECAVLQSIIVSCAIYAIGNGWSNLWYN